MHGVAKHVFVCICLPITVDYVLFTVAGGIIPEFQG